MLLFDEPFAALDRKLREDMQLTVKDLQRELGTTFVFVTHDQEEAFSMADRVALMRDGRIEQLGTPRELYANPVSDFVADFVGVANRIPVDVLEAEIGTYVVRVHGQSRSIKTRGVAGLRPGDRAVLVARPEDLDISTRAGLVPLLTGQLTDTAFVGPLIRARVRVDVVGEVRVSLDNRHRIEVDPRAGGPAETQLFIDDQRTWLVPQEPGH